MAAAEEGEAADRVTQGLVCALRLEGRHWMRRVANQGDAVLRREDASVMVCTRSPAVYAEQRRNTGGYEYREYSRVQRSACPLEEDTGPSSGI